MWLKTKHLRRIYALLFSFKVINVAFLLNLLFVFIMSVLLQFMYILSTDIFCTDFIVIFQNPDETCYIIYLHTRNCLPVKASFIFVVKKVCFKVKCYSFRKQAFSYLSYL